MPKLVSKKAGETATIWLERIKAFETIAADARQERQKFSLAMSLRYKQDPILATLDEETRSLLRESTHDVPYLFRYAQWLKSQATGVMPMIHYPADDGTDFADFAAILLGRVLNDDSGAMGEWKAGMTSLASFGCEAFWYGFHADIITREIAQTAGQSPSDIVNRMAQGDTAPKEGQDHETLAQVSALAAADPEAAAKMPADVQASVMEGAINQRAAADEESNIEQPVGVLGHRVWCRREPVGLKTAWSGDVAHKDDIWWMSRKILLSVPVAQNTSAFDPSARKELKGSPMSEDEGFQPIDSQNLPEFEHENKRVVVYEVWDKRFETRHYISPDTKVYLEVDEENPYVDERGRGVVPGFFPCVISRPLEPDDEGPRRLLGLPLIAPAWDQQREYNEVRSLSISAARRHSIRQYIVHPEINDPAFIEALESGEDGAVIKAPDGLFGDDWHKAVVPLAFAHPPNDLDIQSSRILQDMSSALAWPMASMLGQSVTPTATQEQIGVAAGNAQADDILSAIEADFARGVEIIRGLVRAFYPVEKITALVGPKYAKILEAWRQDSLDGDRLTVKFGARAAAEDKVQIKQKFELLQILMTVPDPVLPTAKAFDYRPLVRSIARDLNEKEPDEFDDTTKQIMVLVQEALAAKQQQAEAQQSVDKSNARKSAEASTNANENSAAQRVNDV